MQLQVAPSLLAADFLHLEKDVRMLNEHADLIHLDVAGRVLEIVGINGEEKTPEEIAAVLEERKKNWQPKPVKYQKGMLRVFSLLAASPMKGAYLDI